MYLNILNNTQIDFKGINYDEEVTYLMDNSPSNDEIKDFLANVSLEGLID